MCIHTSIQIQIQRGRIPPKFANKACNLECANNAQPSLKIYITNCFANSAPSCQRARTRPGNDLVPVLPLLPYTDNDPEARRWPMSQALPRWCRSCAGHDLAFNGMLRWSYQALTRAAYSRCHLPERRQAAAASLAGLLTNSAGSSPGSIWTRIMIAAILRCRRLMSVTRCFVNGQREQRKSSTGRTALPMSTNLDARGRALARRAPQLAKNAFHMLAFVLRQHSSVAPSCSKM